MSDIRSADHTNLRPPTPEEFIEAAVRQRARGIGIVWLNPGEKDLKIKGWTTRSMEPSNYVTGKNLGLMTGWISGNLVCVDHDAQASWEQVEKFLPPTGMIDGRRSKPKSHWWYRVTDIPEEHVSGFGKRKKCDAVLAAEAAGIHPGPAMRHGFKVLATKENILDFIATGGQATVPPSVVSDETRVWYADGDPAVLPFKELWEAVERLAEACGWRRPSDAARRARKAILMLPPAIDRMNGRDRTWEAARRLVNDFALKGEEAWPVFQEYNESCEPPWEEDELRGELSRAIEAGPDERFPHGAALKPEIQVGVDQVKTRSEAMRALLSEPDLFQRDGNLVHIVRQEEDERRSNVLRRRGTPRIVPVQPARLSEMLSSVADWKRWRKGKGNGKSEEAKCLPPDRIVNIILARGQWNGIRNLTGITEVPVLRPDGSLLTAEGYDPATGLYYAPNCPVSVLAEPTPEDARKAVRMLLRIVRDFPFASTVYKAAWLALCLTPFARHAFDGNVPLALIEGNDAGTGKGLLADIVSLAYSGRRLAVSTFSQDDAEMRKTITSLAMAGDPMVVFDNLSGPFGSSALEAAITGPAWKQRELGGNKMTDLPLNITMAATGNRVELVGDLYRRILHIKLDSKHPHPEDRDDFAVKNLPLYVLKLRPWLIGAALTVLRAYFVAGRPDMKLKPWGSFEAWSGVVRSALVFAGQPDPNEGRMALRNKFNRARSCTELVLAGLEALDPGGVGVKAAEFADWCNGGASQAAADILGKVNRKEVPADDPSVAAAVAARMAAMEAGEALKQLGAKLESSVSVAAALRSIEGLVIEDRRLGSREARARAVLYFVERTIP